MNWTTTLLHRGVLLAVNDDGDVYRLNPDLELGFTGGLVDRNLVLDNFTSEADLHEFLKHRIETGRY